MKDTSDTRGPQEYVLEEVLNCWGPRNAIKPTKDPKYTQERTLRQIIGNWMSKALTQSGLDRVELNRDACKFYRIEEGIYFIDGSSLVHAVFQIINPEARINSRTLKEQLEDANVNQFKGDVAEMLSHTEEIYDMMLSEGASHQDFCEDLLKALNTVQHEQLK